MLQIGDIVYLVPTTIAVKGLKPGKIVYVHPELRYYTVEFELGDSHMRESFLLSAAELPEDRRPPKGCRTSGV